MAYGRGKAVAMQVDMTGTGAGMSLSALKKLNLSASSSGVERRSRGRPATKNHLKAGDRAIRPLPVPPPLLVHRPLPLPMTIEPLALRYLFKKELHNSDVSQHHRIIVPKRSAEMYLPRLYDKEGFFINMDDMNGQRVWCFKFRYWPNHHSRMYLLEYTGEFVEAHGLTDGDSICVYKDVRNERYVIEALKFVPPQATNSCGFISESEEENLAYYYFPDSNIDEMGMSFLDDIATPNTFGDIPTNFTGGNLPDVPPLERVPSFGSLNFLLDDLP